jgi:hypothetical protein
MGRQIVVAGRYGRGVRIKAPNLLPTLQNRLPPVAPSAHLR